MTVLALLACTPPAAGPGKPPTDPTAPTTSTTPPPTPPVTTTTPQPTTEPAACALVSVTAYAGAGNEWSARTAVASDGGWFVAVEFDATVTLDPGGPAEATLTPVGLLDLFVARYAADGALSWVRQAGGAGGTALLADLAVTGDDGPVLLLRIVDTIVVGAGTAEETTLAGVGNIAIVQYDADGTVVRAAAEGLDQTQPSAVQVLADDSLVVGGLFFDATMTLAAGTPEETVLAGYQANASSGFLARYAPDGTLTWARSMYGTTGSGVWGVRTDPTTDDLVVVGQANGDGTFVAGEGQPGEVSFVPTNLQEAWLSRWSPDGALQWLVHDPVVHAGVGVADDGAIWTAGGFFAEGLSIGDPPDDVPLPVSSILWDAVVASWSTDGDLAFARTSRSEYYGAAIAEGLAVDPGGGAAVIGTYEDGTLLGAGEPNETALDGPAAEAQNGFLARYGASGALACATAILATDEVRLDDVDRLPDGTWLVSGAFEGTASFGRDTPDPVDLTSTGSDAFVARFAL